MASQFHWLEMMNHIHNLTALGSENILCNTLRKVIFMKEKQPFKGDYKKEY